jgi:Glucodextranase, domain B
MSFRTKPRNAARAAALVALASAALAAASPAAGQVTVRPTLVIDSITLAGGTATVSGAVGGASAATVTVNGQPVPVGEGPFVASVTLLSGQDAVEITLGDTTVRVPLALAGVPDPLAALRDAGVSVVVPPEGFQAFDGLPVTVGGHVLNPGSLASLKVNGQEILGLLNPDGTFTQPVPPGSEEVTVTATDAQGVSQTTRWQIANLSSVIRTEFGPSVSAMGAMGLRIASVRYVTKGVRASRRLRMVVTVKDLRGYLVRGATVRVQGVRPRRPLRSGVYTKPTGTAGRVTFALRPRARAFGKRLYVRVLARTPNARARRTTSVRLPRLARAS